MLEAARMLQKITGNKFICMEFVFAICICTFIYTCKPTAFAQIYWKKTVSQVLFKYFNSAFRKAYFSIIKLSLFNQFNNFVEVFENTFSSFRLWMNTWLIMHLLYPLPVEDERYLLDMKHTDVRYHPQKKFQQCF